MTSHIVAAASFLPVPGGAIEVLDAEWFATTRQAQTVITIWLKQYNQVRPHEALGMRPPVPETN